MCFWHRRRPASRPLRLSTFRTAAPLLAHQICLSAAHTTPAMRSRDPCSSATQRSLTAAIPCFNRMHLVPRPHPPGPLRAPIYGKTLPASLSGAHFCTRAYLLIPFGFSPLANTEVIDRATVCTSRDRGLSRRALRLNLVSSQSLRFVAAGAPTIKPSPHRSPPRYGQSHSTKTVP